MNKKPLTIVYCINTLTGGGGTARVIAYKASYLAEAQNYNIHVIVSRQYSKPSDYHFSEKVTLHFMDEALNVKLPKIPGISFLKHLKNARVQYHNLIQKINPDIVTVVGPFFEDLIVPQICRQLNIYSIREFHTSKKAYYNLGSTINGIYRKCVFHAQRMITLSRFNHYDCVVLLTKEDANESKYKTKTAVIPNISCLGIIDRKPNLASKRVISVGSMRSNVKRFDMQIAIWEKFIKLFPDWTLNIYGDGVEMPKLKKLVESKKLEDSVLLHGSTQSIKEEYLNSSICTFTSVAEGFALTISEAAEAGLPVISINCPHGPSSIIEEGVTGFLIPEGSLDTFLEKLCLLASDEELRNKMSINAKIAAPRFFDDAILPQWVKLYESIAFSNE